MWKIRKLDEQLFMGAAAKIHEFLDIEPLMPPGRLRLSKLLGRPVMDMLSCNCVIANIEELRNLDCRIHGGIVFWPDEEPESFIWTGPSRDGHPALVGVRIISDEDTDWGLAWYKKEGDYWPYTADGTYPPALENLIVPFDDFRYDWYEHLTNAEYDDDMSDEFGLCTICGSTNVEGVEVTRKPLMTRAWYHRPDLWGEEPERQGEP